MAWTGRLAIVAAAILVLGGCSGAVNPTPSAPPSAISSIVSSPTPAPTPTATPTSTPAPTPSPSANLAPLATTYSAISAGGTAALDKCNQARIATDRTREQAQALAKSCRDSYLKYIADLKAVDWGPVQPLADGVIKAADACDAIVVEMINATTGESFMAAYNRLPAATTELLRRADAMRSALGLPPAG